MKINQRVFYAILVLGLLYLPFCSLTTSAQTFDINSPITQQFTITSPGFFPLSNIANDAFQEQFSQNMNLEATFTNFLGGPCTLAPAADFAEIGPPFTITGNSNFLLDFSMASPNVDIFGLSLVPKGSPCTFNLQLTTPKIQSSSSSGSTEGEGLLIPNGITIVGSYLSSNTVGQLSNESTNPGCQNSPSGINTSLSENQIKELINFLATIDADTTSPRSISQKTTRNLAVKPKLTDVKVYSLPLNENKDKSQGVYNLKLTNTTDTTQIYATVIFPSITEKSSVMLGRSFNPEIEVTLKEQAGADLIALAAVQHAIVSATMPWQLSSGNGFFITQGGGCVGPYCTILESGMVVIIPGGACTPEKLSKRKAGYATFNPSMFFDPFPVASKTIQIPSENIVDPKHPLVSKVVQENAYLILQPVPPGAMLIQQLMLSLDKED